MMAPGWQHDDADPIIASKAVALHRERAEHASQPFFLYLSPSAPHEPCTEGVTPEFARGKSGAGPRGDLVWLFDWMVGQVMDALDRTGQAEDTLIIVTSDNGALPGDRVRGWRAARPLPHLRSQVVRRLARLQGAHLGGRPPRAARLPLAGPDRAQHGVRRVGLPGRPDGHLRATCWRFRSARRRR